MPYDGSNVSEVQLTLIAARDLIKKGWCKKAFKKELKKGDHYCIVGAIQQTVFGSARMNTTSTYPDAAYAAAYSPEQVALATQVKEVLKSIIVSNADPYVDHIETWNDQKERKKSEVLEVFDRAIAIG